MSAKLKLTGLLIAAAACAGTLVLADFSLRDGNRVLTFEPAPFLVDALGKPDASPPALRKPARGVTVRIAHHGYTVRNTEHAVSVNSTAAVGNWRTFAEGATRPTPFGSETVTVGPKTTEDWLTVERRQGTRTWRWRIGSHNLTPSLSPDGSVRFASGTHVAPLRIRPVSLFDSRGKKITPAGLRWSLARDDRGYILELPLNDSGLPLPYVIDPATDYGPSTLYITNAVSTTFNGATTDKLLATTAGSSTYCTAGTNCPGATDGTSNGGAGAPLWQDMLPNALGTLYTSTPNLPTTGTTGTKGWIVEGAGASSTGTIIPSGDWTFTFDTKASGTANVAVVTYRIAVGMWIITTSGNSVTSVDSTVIDPTVAVGTFNPFPGNTTQTTRTITASGVPQIALNSNQHLLVRFYGKKVVSNGGSNSRENASVYLMVYSGTSTGGSPTTNNVAHPTAADTTAPSAPTLSSISPGSNSRTNSTTATFKVSSYSDPDSNSGHVNFQVCSDSACNTVLTNGDFDSSTVSSGTSNVTGTPASALSLTDGTTYYWRARSEDSNNAASAFTSTSSFVYDSTVPALSSASVNGSSLTLTYSENLNTAVNPPDGSAYTVTVNGSGDSVTATGVSGSAVTLTLQNAVHADDTVTVAYAQSSATANGGAKVQDQASNLAADFGSTAVTNSTANAAPNVPSLSTADSSYFNTLTPSLAAVFSDPDTQQTGKVTFQLCTGAASSAAAACSGSTTNGAGWDSSSTTLANNATGSATVPGGRITVDGTYYWQARNQDNGTGTLTSNYSATRSFMVDRVLPTYSSSATNVAGTQISLTMTEAASGLDTTSTTPASAFTVNVGGSPVTVSSVSTTDTTHVVLTLASRIYGEDTITVAYSTAGLTTGQQIKDRAANALATFTAQSVTNTAPADTTTSTLAAGTTTIFADSSGGTTSSTITVTLKNRNSTNVGTSGGTVLMSTNLGSLSAVTNVGNGTYTATLTSTAVGTAHITGTLDGRSFTASADVTVSPGLVDHYVVTNTGGGSIGTQTAGTSFNVKIVAQDVNNNTATAFTGTVVVSSNRTCSSGCTTSAAFTAGVLASQAVTLTQAGASSTITATKTADTETGTSNTFTVNPAVLDHFALSLATPQTNGSAFTGTNTLTAQDVYNNTVTSFDASANNVTITANSPLTGIVSGLHGSNVLNQAGDFTGGIANLTTLGITYTGNATAGTFTATSANGKTGSSASVTINPGALHHFAVTNTSGTNIVTQTAGTGFNVKITAQDVSNNTVTGFTGTVVVSSNRTCSSGCTTSAAFTAGVLASHALTLTQAGAGSTITATKSGGSETGTSNTFTVNPAGLDHFTFAAASPQTDGVAFTGTNTLTAQDVYGNTVTSFDASANNVTITALSPLTGAVSGLHGSNVLNLAGDFSSGVANLTSLGMKYTGNAATGTFRATSATGKTGDSGSVTIAVGALDHFAVTDTGGSNIGTQTAGTAFNVKIVAQDVGNNTVTGFTGTVVVSSNRTCSGGCTTSAAFTAGVLSSHAVTLTQAGASSTITATKSGSSEAGTSNTFTVNPAVLDHFTLTLATPQTNGSAFTGTNTLTAQDVYGNTVTSFDASANNVTVAAVSPLTGTVSGLHGANVLNQAGDFSSGVANLTTLGITYTGNATAGTFTATSANGKTGTSASVTINPGALHHFAVTNTSGTNIATQTAGTGFNVKVTAQDASNNTVTGFTGTVVVSSNRTCTSGCTTSAAFTAGVLSSHAVTLTQAGASSTITATKSAGSEAGTSNGFTVNPAGLDHFTLTLATPQTNGSAVTGTNTLTAQDVYGNTVTAFDASANNVTLTANSPLTGTVSGLHGSNVLNQAGDFSSGVANLTTLGLTYTGNSTAGTFTATSANGKTGTSSSVTVNPGAVDHYVVTNTSGTNIATQTAGTGFNVKVVAQDVSNNTATSFTGTVDLTSNRTCSSGCTTSAAFTAGVLSSHGVTLTQAGASSTITATKSGGSQAGTSNTFTVNPATFDHFALTLATPQTNGSAFTGTNTLTAQDLYNNTITTFDASANNVTITANSPLTGTVSGLHGSNVLNQAGDFTGGVANLTTLGITYTGNATAGTFTASSANGKTGTSSSVTINPGALHHFAVTNTSGTNIATQTAGTGFNVKVTAQDGSNNTVTGFTGTVDLTSNSTCSSGCTTSAAFTAGVLSSHAVTLTQAGASSTITATKTGSSETGTSNTFTVNPAALDHFSFSAATPQTNAVAFTGTNTLTAQDLYNNTITTFDASANNVTITANSPLTGTVSGLHGSNVLNQAGDFTGGVANLTTLGITYTGNATAGTFTASSANGKTGTSSSVTINPGALHHFAVTNTSGTNIATQTAGTGFNVKVTAQDGSNNTVTGFTGTVDLTSNSTCSSGCTTSAAFTAGVLSSHAVTLTQAGASSTITATKTGSSETGTSNTFTVNPAALDHFTLTLATPQTNGSAFTGANTLTAQDVYGNTVTAFDASANNVTLTANSPLTGTVSGLHGSNVLNQAGDFTSGVANLTTLGITYTGNATAGTFTATSATGKTGDSGSVTMSPGAVDHFTVTNTSGANIGTQTAGASFNVKVTAQDASNNTVTSFTGTADLTSNRTCSAGCTTSAAFTAGVLSSHAVTLTQAGAASTITATKTGNSQTGTSNTFTVNPAALHHFSFSLVSPQTNAVAFTGTNTLTAQDTYGNTVTSFDASVDHVSLSVSPAGAVAPTTLQGGDFVNGVADLTSVGLAYTGTSGARTFTATAETGETGTSASVTINPGALDHFVVANTSGGAIGTQTAGASFNVKVTAQDGSNNTVTGFTGTVDLTSNRTCSSGCTTSAAFTAGVLSSHGVTLTQAGASSTITATKTGGSETGTSNTFTVNPAALDHFSFSAASPQTNAVAFTGTNTLTAQDLYNNTVTTFDASANNVTITAVSPLTGTVSGLHGANVLDQAGDFSSGVANLTSLGITYTGNAATGALRATAANGKTGDSGALTINPGALHHFAVTTTGGANIGTQTAGSSFNVKVTAQDGSNNTVTGFTGTVDLTSNRTCTSGCTTSAAFTSGVLSSHALTLTQSGSATLTATKSGGSETGTSNTFTVNSAALDHFILTLDTPQTNGIAFTGTNTLTAQDVYGNTVTAFDASANNVTITANSPLTGTASGLHGSNVLNQAGDFTSGVANLTTLGLTYTGNATTGTFTATSANGKTGDSDSVAVNPGALDHFVVTNTSGANIGTQTAGSSFNVKVTAQDGSNNTVTGFTGTVDLTSNRTCSAGCTTSAAFTAGVLSSQAVTLTQAGASSTITATKTADTETGTSNTFTVNPAVLDHFALSLASPQTNGSGFTGTNTLTAQDVYNNTVTSFDASANNVTITANSPLTGIVSGLHSSNVLNQAGDFTGGIANLTTLGITYTGNATAGTFTATSANGKTGTSSSVTINPGALHHFAVTNTSGTNIVTQTAGTGFNVKITAQDASNNTVTSFTGTADLTSNRTCTSGCTTSASFSAGVLSSHALTLTQSGSATVTATKTGSSETGTSNSFTVNPAALDHFALSLASPQTNGSAFTGTNTLTAQDVYNNTVATFDASANNVTIGADAPLTGSVSGLHGSDVLNQAADFINGVANLTTIGLAYSGNATVGTFTASSATGKTGTSASVTINPGALHHFAVTNTSGGNIASQTAGNSFNVKLAAQDASNNTVTSFTGTADLTSNRTCSSGCTTTAAFTAGVLASHAITLTQAGASSIITATKTGGGPTGNSNSFTVNSATLDHFALSLASPQTNGSAFTGSNTLVARDAYDNAVTSFDASVNSVTLTVDSPFTGTVSGLHGANVLNQATDFTNGVANLTTLGLTYTGNATTGTFTATSATGKTGSSSITVDPGALDHFIVTNTSGGNIATQTAGDGFNIEVTAQDASNNTATGFTGTVTTTSNRNCSDGCTTSAGFTAGVLSSQAVTLTEAGSGSTITVTKSGGSQTGTSNSFTVNPGAASNLVVTQQPTDATTGNPFGTQPHVAVTDQFANVRTSDNSTVVHAALIAGTGPLTGTVDVTASSGEATFTDLEIDTPGSGKRLRFTATGLAAADSDTFNVSALPTHLEITAINPASPTAGNQFSVTVIARDDGGFNGNVSTNTDVSLSLGTGNGTVGGTVTGTIPAGSSSTTISGVTYTKAESGIVLTASRTSGDSLASGDSSGFTVVAAAVDHFAVTDGSGGNIGSQTAGAPFDTTLTAQDQFDNTATSFTDTVDISTNCAFDNGDFTTDSFTSGVLTQSVTLTHAAANCTITVTRTSGSETGTSNTFTVNPDVIDHFTMTAASTTMTAGESKQLTIGARDAYDNTVTAYTGVHDLFFSGAGASGSLAQPTVTDKDGTQVGFGDDTAITFTNGISSAGGSMSLYKAETATINVNDTATFDDFSFSVTVGTAPFAQFGWSLTSPQTNTVAFAGANTLTAQDAYGNTVTDFDAAADHVTLTADPSGSVSPGTLDGSEFVNGVANLTTLGLTYTGGAGLRTLTATAETGESSTSNDITINPGSLDHFAVTAAGGGGITAQTAGASFDVKVTAQDVSNNTATSFAGTVTMSSNRTCSAGCTTTPAFTNGVLATHAITLTQAASGSTITATGGGKTGTSNSFAVVPGALDHFRVRNAGGNAIGTQTAGTGFALEITAQDQFDNTQTGFAGTVDVTSNRTISAGGGTTASFTSGVLTGHSLTLTQSGANSTITVSKTGGVQTGTSNTFTVDSAGLDHFTFALTDPQTNGFPFSGANTLTAADQFGNTVTSFDAALDTVTITANSPLVGVVSGLHGAGNELVGGDFVGGVADLTALGMTYTGNASTSTFHAVSSVSHKTVDSNAIEIVGGAATHFTVSATGAQTAGSAFDVTVIALDANQNIAFDYPGEIHFSSTDTQAVLPSDFTFDDADDGQHVFSVTLKQAPSQTLTVTDTSDGAITGTSSLITVNPASLDHFQVRNSSGGPVGAQTAGSGFTVKITAQDQFDNTQTAFTGAVDVTSNRTISAGGGATASFSGGVLTGHSLTLTQSGANSTITVTKTGGVQTGTSNTFTVDAAPAATLDVTSVPGTDVTAGAPFSVSVRSRDAYGNLSGVTADTAFQLNASGSGTIGGNTGTLTAGTSLATLSAVTYTKAGALTLIAHRTSGDSLSDSAQSSTISIIADSLDHFLVQNAAGGTIGGQVAGVGFALKITAQDQFDNLATSFVGTAAITSNRTCSAGCVTTAAFSSGILTGHSVTLTQAGSASTITATSSGKTGASNGFTVDPAAATHYTVGNSSPQIAGTAFAATVTALDSFDNVATHHTGTIHFTSSDGQAVLPSNYTFMSGDNGAHEFSLTLKTAGTQTVTATNTVTGSINGTSNSITVNPAAASRFVVTGSSLQAAGTAQQVTVTARDPFGNTAAGYTGDKSIIFSGAGASPNATLPTATSKTGTAVEFGSPTTITFTSGVSSAGGSIKLYKSEIANIVATDSGITTTGARRLTVTVSGGTAAAAASTISASPATLTADDSSTSALTVQLEDGYGNDVTTSGGTVTLSTSKGTIGSSCTANCATVDQDDGTYTATFTAGTIYGPALITAKLNGAAFTHTASVLLLSSNLSLSASTITADPSAITADGSSTSTVTVQLKDVLGSDLTATQGTVTLATTRGSLSAVTDNGDGTYTATLTSSTSAGSATVTGKLNGADLVDTASVALTAGTPTQYLVSVSNPSPVAGDDVTVTAQLADANNNPVSTAGVPVNWSNMGGGFLSSTTTATNSTGVATVTLTTAATTAGTSYTVTADDDSLHGTTAPFTSVPGSASAATSTIMPSAPSIVANGSSTLTLTVQLKDANGNDLTSGGGTVALATSLGTLGSVTNHADGTYTATLTAGLVSGTAHVTATLNGSTLAHTADVSFTPDAPAKFLVTSSSLTPVAGNNVTITAQLADANGNAVSEPSHTATWSKNCGGGSFSAGSSLTNGSGVATVTFTTPASVGSCTVTATEGSMTGTSPSIASIPGSASMVNSTIAASPTTITANGSSTSTITVQLKDANANNLSSGGTVVIAKQSGGGTLGGTTNNGNGSYSATLTASSSNDTATIGASVNGSNMSSTVSVAFVGATAPSLVASTPTNGALLGGLSQFTLTANMWAAWTGVSLQKPDGSGVGLPDGAGTSYAGAASATTPGSYTIRATMIANGLAIPVTIRFTVLEAPRLLSATPADGSTVAGTAQIALTANHSVTWRDWTVTKDAGTPKALAGGTGVAILRDFASTGAGSYTIQVTMDDGITAPVTVVTHFTVSSSTPTDPSPTKLALSIISPSTFKPTKSASVFTIRAKATMAATVRADLYSSKNLHLNAWRFNLKAGTSVVKLKWPSKIRSKGVYKLVLTAQSKGQVTKKTVKVRLL